MRKTREELEREIVRLGQHALDDKALRQEFAKAFGWTKPVPYTTGERVPLEPSWQQVFVELGKVLAARNFMDLEGNVSELEVQTQKILNAVRDLNPGINL